MEEQQLSNSEVVEAVRNRTNELCLGHDFLFHYDGDHDVVRVCRLVGGSERELASVQDFWVRTAGRQHLIDAALRRACDAARER